MNRTKLRIWVAILCVIVFVLCVYYFATRDNNKNDNSNTQAQICIIQ